MILPCEELEPVRPCSDVDVNDGGDEFREIEFEEEPIENDEARQPKILRDPGAPTEAEVERHNVTHMPYRSWCPACVEGKARDKHHSLNEEQDQKGVPEIVFDYGFLGSEGEETIAIQVARDRRTRMLFAHVVPKKGFTHEHGAAEMIKDIVKLGYKEVVLKCDGEAALKSIQDEVRRQRAEPTILENSPVGDSRANGAAERAVQALGEQVRVLRRGLEQRLGLRLSGKHPVTAWLVEHAADLLSKYQVGNDGKTGYERWKGKPYRSEEIEFGEKVHYRLNLKAKSNREKLEVRWGEGFYLGRWWRTGEAIIGAAGGTLRAGTVRRVGAHRRWDREGLEKVKGLPWKWDPGEGETHAELKVRWLAEDELQDGQAAMSERNRRIYRLRLKREDFLKHGFTEGCPGCQAVIAGTIARGHTEACRTRMNTALDTTDDGKLRRTAQDEKETEALARILQEHDEARAKKAKTTDVQPSTSSSDSPADPSVANSSGSGAAAAASSSSAPAKRWADQEDNNDDGGNSALWDSLAKIRRGPPTRRGEKRSQEDPGDEERTEVREHDHRRGEKRLQEDPGDEERIEVREHDQEDSNPGMDISYLETNLYQDDMKWTINEVSDMCEPTNSELQQQMHDMAYFDENTWEQLDARLVEAAEKAELARFQQMGVYEYVTRSEALNDPEGIFVNVKWVRTNKGTYEDPNIKCRLVAQELGYGQRVDELFSGTPSLQAMRLVILHAAKGGRRHRGIMVLDVKCAFLYGQCVRRIYIELPHRDPRAGDRGAVGRLRRALYGTRDAPQIWAREVEQTMTDLGFSVCLAQPSVFHHVERDTIVVVHVDDFLCSGVVEDLQWLYESLAAKYELKQKILDKCERDSIKYLGRTVTWNMNKSQFEIEGDIKHVNLMLDEWGMNNCKEVDTPMSKDGMESIDTGNELPASEATRARRAIARVNYMAQDRPDLAFVARIMSQHMAAPRDGIVLVIKRVLRYLKRFPRCVLTVPTMKEGDVWEVKGWADSDWATDPRSRKSCSGGFIMINDLCVAHWSKTQSNVALSSGEAELNAAVKALSEIIGLHVLLSEVSGSVSSLSLHVDSSACKAMLLRQGAGRVKHLAVKQLWSQGAVQSYGISIVKIPREINAADALTHWASHSDLHKAVLTMGFSFPNSA